MLKARNLIRGDKVAIVAASRKIERGQLDTAVRVLESWGLDVTIMPHVFDEAHSYLASTDANRLQDLQHAINDQSIAAIFFARGGYGLTRIIEQVDWAAMRNSPKWLIGFSDITAVHLALFREGVISIHGPMPLLFNDGHQDEAMLALQKVLFESHHAYSFVAKVNNRAGIGEGRLIGGNLSLIVDSLGTPSEPDMTNCILFIEEIDEYFYKIDRMLRQLKRAGKLSRLSALLVGHFTDIKESSLPFGSSISDLILDAVADYSYPVAFGFPAGHQAPNLAFLHGAQYELTVQSAESRLISRSLAL